MQSAFENPRHTGRGGRRDHRRAAPAIVGVGTKALEKCALCAHTMGSMPLDPQEGIPQPQPRPAPWDGPAMTPVLAPIKDESSFWARGGKSRLRLAAVALLAAGLAIAVVFKGNLKPTVHPSAPPAAAAVANPESSIQRAAVPVGAAASRVAPATASPPEPETQGGGIAFKDAPETQGSVSPSPQTCASCWNKAHSGETASGDSLPGPLRPVKTDDARSLGMSPFELPDDASAGSRMGDLPASWEQCPQK